MTEPELLIGVVGGARSGKDTVGTYLAQKHGALNCSLSTKLKETPLTQQQVDQVSAKPTSYRMNLREKGRQLRLQHGLDILVRWCLEDWQEQYAGLGTLALKNCVITGHMTPEEQGAIRRLGGALFFLSAPAEVRYLRSLQVDQGTAKQATPEDFKRQDIIDRLGLAGPDTPYDDWPILWPRDAAIDTSQPLEAVYRQLDRAVERYASLASAAVQEPDELYSGRQSGRDREMDGYLAWSYARYHSSEYPGIGDWLKVGIDEIGCPCGSISDPAGLMNHLTTVAEHQ